MASIVWDKFTADQIQFGKAGAITVKIIPLEDGRWLARLTPAQRFSPAWKILSNPDQAREWAAQTVRKHAA